MALSYRSPSIEGGESRPASKGASIRACAFWSGVCTGFCTGDTPGDAPIDRRLVRLDIRLLSESPCPSLMPFAYALASSHAFRMGAMFIKAYWARASRALNAFDKASSKSPWIVSAMFVLKQAEWGEADFVYLLPKGVDQPGIMAGVPELL